MDNNYYVYILAYPDGRVFYVGKGTHKRMYEHEKQAKGGDISKKSDIIRDIWGQGGQVLKRKLYNNLTEQDAHAIESILIALFDRANLANQQEGHRNVLVKRKLAKREQPRIIGYKNYTYEENGLYGSYSIPIYEEEFPFQGLQSHK